MQAWRPRARGASKRRALGVTWALRYGNRQDGARHGSDNGGNGGTLPVVTIYSGARAPAPVDAADLPWPELATELEALANEPTGAPVGASEDEQKRRMVAWAPHALRIPYRRAENVAHVSLLVVDVDNDDRPTDPVRPEDVVAYMRSEGIEGLVYESPRSTPTHPKFRVIATTLEPIPPTACRETRTRFAELLGLGPRCGVHGAIDEAKLFFSGRLHGTPPRRVWRVDGVPLDAKTLPPNSAAWGEAFASAPSSASAAPHLAELPPADQGIVAAIGDWRQHAGRKWLLCGAIGGLLRKFAYTPYQAEAVIRAWLPADDPTVDVDAGVEWALGAWRHSPEDVSGHAELVRHLGEQHADVIERAAWAGSFAGRAAARAPKAPERPAFTFAAAPSNVDPLGTRHAISGVDTPLSYVCAGLCLAPNLGGKISLVGGLPGAGKGPLEAYICVCVALGHPLFERWPVVRQRVLYLDVEGYRLTRRRFRRIALALGEDPDAVDDWIDLRDASQLAILDDRTLDAIERHDARFVALDSYTTAMLRYDLDQNKNEYSRGAQALAMLADRVVLPIAHARKPNSSNKGETPDLTDISGSGALGALAQTGISVWRPDPEVKTRVRIGCLRAPETPFETFDIEFRDTPNGGLALAMITAQERQVEETRAANVTAVTALNAVLAFMRANAIPWSRKELSYSVLVGAERLSEGQIATAIAQLCAPFGGTGAPLVVRHASIGSKGPTFEIRSVQDTPAAVEIDPNGFVMPAIGAWRKPA